MNKKQYRLLTMLALTSAFVLNADFAPECEKLPCVESDICCPQNTCGRFFVGADLLYWKPHISGLELGAGTNNITQTTVGDDFTITVTDEFDEDPHFKWNAGYRIGAGYQFACSDWAAGAVWTHFQGNGTRNIDEDADTINTTKCGVKFDQVDLILAYNTHLGSCSKVRPYIGLRGSKIHESLHALLTTDILIAPDTVASSLRTLDDRQNYHGIGPIVGLEAEWDLGCGLGLYGSATAGLLYGNYRVTFEDSTVSSAPISDAIFSTDKRHLHTFDWNIDLAIGIRWETTVCDSYQLGFKLGFEHHQYFNQSHLGTDCGDLTFDGGVFGIDLAL